MDVKSEVYQQYLAILKEELVPSMGCTEPIALAYAAARCRCVLGVLPQQVLVQASGSIIKNVKSVFVPNTGGLKGLEAAVAAGIVAGNADKELEVIAEVSQDKQNEICEYLKSTDIQVDFLESDEIFDLIVTLRNNGEYARVRISGYHTNIVLIEKNGTAIFEKIPDAEKTDGLTDRSVLNMDGIWDFTTTCPIEDVREILDRQIACNMAIAQEGLQGGHGAGIGTVLVKEYGDNVRNRAAAMAAAGADARMSGCEMPVIINSGSGNQGIACSVPVIVFAHELCSGAECLYRALVLSNLTTIHQKTGIGRLSAFCGVVCAGVGAGAGITYLKGGGLKEVSHTIVNGLATASGMVCDGAKASCAAKIALAVNAGLLGYDMYAQGYQFYSGDGLVSKGVDNTICNIGRLGRDGMSKTNEEIIKIMMCQ